MNNLQNLLNQISFQDNVNFELNGESIDPDSDPEINFYKSKKPLEEYHDFIDSYRYLRKHVYEYWTSLNIKIRNDRTIITLEKLGAFIGNNSLNELYINSENSNVFYDWEIDKKVKGELLKIDSNLILIITKFD